MTCKTYTYVCVHVHNFNTAVKVLIPWSMENGALQVLKICRFMSSNKNKPVDLKQVLKCSGTSSSLVTSK